MDLFRVPDNMQQYRRMFVVVPTFRETEFVRTFLDSWRNVGSVKCELVICNANPGDETTILLNEVRNDYPHTLTEIKADSSLFWSGLVDLGLHHVHELASDEDICLITNIDITFEGDPTIKMISTLREHPNSQIAAIARGSNGRILSAGVEVKSWALSLNRHLFQGQLEADSGDNEMHEATYLPTRFVMFPVHALSIAGFPDSEHLPHYCADFEFTNRLRMNGYIPRVLSSVIVNNVDSNTGFKTFEIPTTLLTRLCKCFDKKCTYNLRYRFWFVWLTYPGLWKLPGLVSHFLKIFLEIAIGGRRLRQQ